ncbi:MAG TPA: hypothetical protein VKA68_11635 [bacterium]|nr:hypothetical protein [bacterium]
MKKTMTSIIGMLLCFVFLGCEGELTVQDARAVPREVSAGDPITLYVIVQGPTRKIASVSGSLREDPSMRFRFNNDGSQGDKVASDNIWTHQSNAPGDAPVGTYHLDIVVRDSDGHVITSEGNETETRTAKKSGTSGTIEVQVRS